MTKLKWLLTVTPYCQNPWGPELASQSREGLTVKEAALLGWEEGQFQDTGPGGRYLPPHPMCGAHTGLIVGTEDPGQGLGWAGAQGC